MMLRNFALAAAVVVLSYLPASAQVGVTIQLGNPYPPPPVYYPVAQPVVVQPRPVIVHPRPVVVQQQPVYYGLPRSYGNGNGCRPVKYAKKQHRKHRGHRGHCDD